MDTQNDSKLKQSVLVAEDHEVMRRGIRSVVDGMEGWEICAEVTTGADAVRAALEFRPQIAVLDVIMPDMNGIEATRRIRNVAPDTEILILTGYESEELVREAIDVGAKSFISKTDGSVMHGYSGRLGRVVVMAASAVAPVPCGRCEP